MGVVPSTLRLHFLHSLRIPTALTPSSTPYPSEPNGGASLSFPPSPQENLFQQPRPSTPAVDEGSPCRAPYNNNLEEEESHSPYCKSGESDAAPPDVPVELSTPTTEQVGDSPGTTLSDKSPFAFTPSQLASLLGSKDLSALEAIGGVASLFEGLGTDPTRGLCTTRRNARSPQRPTQPQKLKRKKVGPHITPSIICDRMDDMRNPYDATLQERRQVFGENFFSPHANKPGHTTPMDTVMHYWTGKRVGLSNWYKGRQFRALKRVKVIRNEIERTINTREVVVGDIALLQSGEVIPCDGILLFGDVVCDESVMAGQSAAIKKKSFDQCIESKQVCLQHDGDIDELANNTGESDCFIVGGSRVLEGVGRYLVTAVGSRCWIMKAHEAPTRRVSDESFRRFPSPAPEVFPIVGPDIECNISTGLDHHSVAIPTHPPECCHTSSSTVAMHHSHSGPLTSDSLESPALLEMGQSPNHPGDTVDDNNNDILDIQSELHGFTERASQYCSDLGDNVDRDSEIPMCLGGNATVYRGTLYPEGIAVAVKMVRFGDKSDIRAITDICREAHVWSKLCHNNVLRVLGFTTKFDHTISIVSPWMKKGNAHDYVQNVNVDPRPLLIGIATGLQYLHDCTPDPIYHGDLKGANVLISDDGRPLLADFGYSFIVNSSFSIEIESRKSGTLHWTAPEYFHEEGPITAEGDIWAFGMTAVELFTRQRPFPEVNTFPKLVIRQLADYSRPSDEVTHSRLTDGWWKICRRCWDLDPSKRPRMSDILANIPMDSSHT